MSITLFQVVIVKHTEVAYVENSFPEAGHFKWFLEICNLIYVAAQWTISQSIIKNL